MLYFTLGKQFINGYGWNKGALSTTVVLNAYTAPPGIQNASKKPNEVDVVETCTTTTTYEWESSPLKGSNPLTADQQGAIGLPNYSSHYMMLTSYFSNAVNILAAWDHNAHTTKQYAMAMLYGLDNAKDGTAAQQTLLQTEYNNLLTQYGISSSELNAFYSANLKVTTGNLPKSGC